MLKSDFTLCSTQEYQVLYSINEYHLKQSFELREEVFAKELNWVEESIGGLEIDKFDTNAYHVVMIDSCQRVVGTARLVGASHAWMLDECFPKLAEKKIILKEWDSAELSRFAVDRDVRGLQSHEPPSILLLKGVLQLAYELGFDQIYAVVAKDMQRFLKYSGIPLVQEVPFVRMNDGVWAGTVSTRLAHTIYQRWLPDYKEKYTLV